MPKIKKKDLVELQRRVRFTINDSAGAVGAQEKEGAKKAIQIRTLELINALNDLLTEGAKKIVSDCESLIDEATNTVLRLKDQIDKLNGFNSNLYKVCRETYNSGVIYTGMTVDGDAMTCGHNSYSEAVEALVLELRK